MESADLLTRGHPNGTPQARRAALGAGAGAAIEVYDFIGYGTAAALYLGHAFFADVSPAAGTLLAFATLGVGFVARPIGGIAAGHFGDKVGRKPVLIASMLLMGVATVTMGLLPTYAQIGVLAPILLVLVRVIQGLAFGAEWGGAVLMTYEHAPLHKKGRYTGLMHAGFAVGLLLANLAFLAAAPLGNNWSWRIPFLGSAVLVAVGFFLRAHLNESPVFENMKKARTRAESPIKQVLVQDWRAVLRGTFIRLAEPAGYAVGVTFMLSYLKDNHLASNSIILVSICVAAAIGIVATPLWGALSDRIGRKPLFLGACTFGVLIALPIFLLANTGAVLAVLIVLIVMYPGLQNALVAAQGTILPEMYRAEIRSSGASLAYQFSAVVAGFTPFIASALYLWVGWIGPAVLLAGLCTISGVAVAGIRESWGPQTRAAARDLIAQAGVPTTPDFPTPRPLVAADAAPHQTPARHGAPEADLA